RGVTRREEGGTDSIVQIDDTGSQAVDGIARIDQVGKVIALVSVLPRRNDDCEFLIATQHIHLEILIGRMQVQSGHESGQAADLLAIDSL
ncbi:hypothetical protein ABTJ50_20900, partial [Acinetobacter baumannii]